jgi:hypothetical protein
VTVWPCLSSPTNWRRLASVGQGQAAAVGVVLVGVLDVWRVRVPPASVTETRILTSAARVRTGRRRVAQEVAMRLAPCGAELVQELWRGLDNKQAPGLWPGALCWSG